MLRRKHKTLLFICFGLMLSGCHARNSQAAKENGFTAHARGSLAELTTISRSFNFDGDAGPDSIFYDFTGGAHCCYRIFLKLDTTDSLFQVPLMVEGGYLFGLDFTRPQFFDAGDFDGDGLEEIWVQKPGVTGNVEQDLKDARSWIVEFEEGSLAIEERTHFGKPQSKKSRVNGQD